MFIMENEVINSPIEKLPNTSPLTIRRLKFLEIKTYFDLLNYFPFRYEDYSLISSINRIQPAETVTIKGKITEAKFQISKRGLRIQNFKIADETGMMQLIFYNQPYLMRLLKKGLSISVAGEVKLFGQKMVMEPKIYEIANRDHLIHTGRLVPVYPEIRGLSSRTIREKIFYLLYHFDYDRIQSCLEEFLPTKITIYNNLIDELSAYQNIHFPKSKELAQKARERLAFDELFLIQLSSQLVKKEWKKEKVGNRFTAGSGHDRYLQDFVENLPFKLTRAQKRVWGEIRSDILKTTPMNRFLQGEVGSGKTVVAALACYLTYLNGYQSLLMAPTQILAQQHYHTITNLFKKSEIINPKITLITSSQKISSFQFPTSKPASSFQHLVSSFDIIIGTHALIAKKRSFEKVGLVIVDEQHRFGVAQRAALKNQGINPHLLTMTATPIPRTIALTLYGELDLSLIDEMPVGRLPVKTFFVSKSKRHACYQWIKSQLSSFKSQVFIVCPLIDESQSETMKSVKAAKKEFQTLKKIFSEFRLGLLHGQLKSKDKEQIMIDFKNHLFDILVTTPVVEVGVDIENATIMIIEGAERFGLAQLHQLRGRVGRGKKQSYCFLFTESEELKNRQRLDFFVKNQDGQRLAEKDLEIRGPGNIYGTKQHGYLNLKIASLTDFQLINKTRSAVDYFLSHYKTDQCKLLNQRIKNYQVNTVANN